VRIPLNTDAHTYTHIVEKIYSTHLGQLLHLLEAFLKALHLSDPLTKVVPVIPSLPPETQLIWREKQTNKQTNKVPSAHVRS